MTGVEQYNGVLKFPLVMEMDSDTNFKRKTVIFPRGMRIFMKEDIRLPSLVLKEDLAEIQVIVTAIAQEEQE